MQKAARRTYNATSAILAKETDAVIRFCTMALSGMLGVALLAGCTPTVRVEAPREPITINLNIKLDADVRVQLEDQAREDISANPDIF